MLRTSALAFAILALCACGAAVTEDASGDAPISRRDAGPTPDAGSAADAGSRTDAGSADAGARPDAGSGNADAGTALGQGFAGGFTFSGGSGGFGGGSCTATRTPIVFLHGNGDDASVWSRAASTGGPSVLASLQAAGWNACELFGLTWLTPTEQLEPELVYHDEARQKLIADFLDAVRAYTGQAQVDVVGHSMGVTIALHALEKSGQAAKVRRFVSISGGLRGLQSCLVSGPANPEVATCGSQNLYDSDVFGFYPSSNARMQSGGFRDRPASLSISFYSIRAGDSDEVLCATSYAGCDSALFDADAHVISQLDVGVGAPTWVPGDDDSIGVGHFRARSNSGPLLVNFLGGSCSGSSCCSGYGGTCGP